MANKTLVAAAGEHYVAYFLSRLGLIAALVRQGSPSIDVLASNQNGSKTVGIQVKTTGWAERTRGRGTDKKPFELQFPLGHRAIEEASPSTVFCFEDLRDPEDLDARPDVYIVPTKVLMREYRGDDIRRHSYFRHHRRIERMARFKNDWRPILEALK